jgi:negative modulator of initiation of replication
LKIIEIEDDLYKYILSNIEDFGETPSEILRRMLLIEDSTKDKTTPILCETPDKESNVTIKASDIFNRPRVRSAPTKKVSKQAQNKKTAKKEKTPKKILCKTERILQRASIPDVLTKGVGNLYASRVLRTEPIIVNKFKMMLIAMYYENKDAFMDAIKVVKGARRAYIGIELDTLLASDNQEEVDILIASKPKEIPYTPLWVVTNTNTGRKRIILTQMMVAIGYPHNLIERIKDEI